MKVEPMDKRMFIVTSDEACELDRLMSYPDDVRFDSSELEWLKAHEYKERTCEDIAAEYGKFVCSVCGCVVHDTSVIDNGALNYCPDCRAEVID